MHFLRFFANLVGSLYNITDQIFIGQKLGTVGNAASNIAFPLVLLMTTFSTMIGSGGSSRFSLYQGAGDSKKAGKMVGNSLTALVLSGIGQSCQPVFGYNYGAGNYSRRSEKYFFAATFVDRHSYSR